MERREGRARRAVRVGFMAKADLLWRVTRVVDGFSRSHEREEEEQSEALPTLGRVRFDQDQGGFEFVKCSEIQTGQSG